MKIILIIIAVLLFDWGIGYLLSYNKKKQLKRDEGTLMLRLELILKNSSMSQAERIERAKEVCSDTDGKMAAGAYFALYNLKPFVYEQKIKP